MAKREDPLPCFKDFFDFYNQWLFLRPEIARLTDSGRISGREAAIIRLMMELIDRVGPSDLDRG